MFKIMTTSEYGKLVIKVGRTVATLKSDAHLACQNALIHIVKHGDITRLNDLVKVMDHASHNNAVRHWFDKYGKGIVTWATKEKSFAVNKEGVAAIVAGGEETLNEVISMLDASEPYYELTSQPKFTPFILANEIAKIISKAEKRKQENHEEDNFEGLDKLLNALKNIDQSKAAEVMTKIKPVTTDVVTH